jgi:hypothetical protein
MSPKCLHGEPPERKSMSPPPLSSQKNEVFSFYRPGKRSCCPITLDTPIDVKHKGRWIFKAKAAHNVVKIRPLNSLKDMVQAFVGQRNVGRARLRSSLCGPAVSLLPAAHGQLLKTGLGFPLAHGANRGERRQLLLAGAAEPILPAVTRLSRDSNERSIICGTEARSFPL